MRQRQRAVLAVKLLVALALLTAPPPAQSARGCVTEAQATALTLVALPEILREAGRVCAARVAPDSLLRGRSSALLTLYDAAADRAWPDARGAIAALADPTASPLVQSNYARPFLTALIAPRIVGGLAPDDCPRIDRIVTLLEPLAPARVAGVIVETVQFLRAQRARGATVAVPDLPLCDARARR